MQDKLQVLVIGRQPEIIEAVLKLINNTPDWEAAGALADEEAIELYQQRRFDLILIGGGLFLIGKATHAEIRQALDKQQADRYALLDNPFSKN